MMIQNSLSKFYVGQRVINELEIEKGLGTIITIQANTLIVYFSQTAEKLVYSLRNCPLVSITFSVGDTVLDEWGACWKVSKINIKNNVYCYGCHNSEGAFKEIVETALSANQKINRCIDKLFHKRIDFLYSYHMRLQTIHYKKQRSNNKLFGLLGPKVQLIPHQFYIAKEVAGRFYPRVMLSDEVGLGKTIEAGLIMHQQLLTGRAKKILLITPENLLQQWLVEMLRRFNLTFHLLNMQAFLNDQIEIEHHNVEEEIVNHSLILCSYEYLYQNKPLQRILEVHDFDLMVIDEAHHINFNDQEDNQQYECIKKLSEAIPGLILITATPKQLGDFNHFLRLKLLDSDRFNHFLTYQESEKKYENTLKILNHILEGNNLSTELIQSFAVNDQSLLERLQLWNEAPQINRKIQVDSLVKLLIDRHGTGRILFRNTRQSIGGFPKREIYPQPIEISESYHQSLKTQTSIQSFLYTYYLSSDNKGETESINESNWWKNDPKIIWLCRLIKQLPNEKILIICQSSVTVGDLSIAMRVLLGLQVAVFHEKMTLIERDRAAVFFADFEDTGASVLVCSEIGSEGRNFQFAHHLILFDLPLSADLIEQRIGRLDRIGQTHTIKIYIPYLAQTPQEFLFQWYNQGLNNLKNHNPAASETFESLKDDLKYFIQNYYFLPQTEIQAFIDRTIVIRQNLEKQFMQGRDRLLEMTSKGLEDHAQLIKDFNDYEKPDTLKQYMQSVFDYYGVENDSMADNMAMVLQPSNSMTEAFPFLPDEGCTITYDRQYALTHDTFEFLTWEHPMVIQVMDNILETGAGNVTIAQFKTKQLPLGSILLEVLVVAECIGDAALQLDRYFPLKPFRFLLNEAGHQLNNKIDLEMLHSYLKPITDKKLIRYIIDNKKETIRNVLDNLLQNTVFEKTNELIVAAKCTCSEKITEEIIRLETLSKLNHLVKEQEITYLKKLKKQTLEAIDQTKARLDSICLIVAC